ncbi:MAG: metallophosphoesterase family protein [Gracilibacteraceae bacterium]|jgi:calcineurin-like phosphoesterase family protein|nr:metallophosphoesterase family protein [Gracilibacteraceae bacterium]
MIYFTADLHFGHANIIRHCNRPFPSADKMDAALIRNWNAAVNPKDDVYILGDLTMAPAEEAHDYLLRLNGRKYLIRGNHDKFLNGFEPFADDFVWVKDYFAFKHNGVKYVLFHYPIAEWAGFFGGAVHLYGHVHNSELSGQRLGRLYGKNSRAINVGTDLHGFRPVSIDKINALAGAGETEG